MRALPCRMLEAVTTTLMVGAVACAPAAEEPPVPSLAAPPGPSAWRIEPLGVDAVTVDDEFWAPRMQRNREVTIPHILRMNEATGRVDNFRKAARLMEGAWEGYRFNDTDVYKVIEAASYALAQQPDAALDARVDELVALIAASQQDDGYLFPAWSIDPANPPRGVGSERWIYVHGNSHELYGAGHLIEAAVAHHRATGKRNLLDVALRLADHIDSVFGPRDRRDVPGHEEIELALVKLHDLTGEARYLELSRFFLDERGRPHPDGVEYPPDDPVARYSEPVYRQDHLPVSEQREAVGHSVRAMYLYTGMADVAARAAGTGYEAALEALWEDVTAAKMYLTGGIGAAGSIEGFGERYELPNHTAYAETCAAIGLDLWNHRMFLASGEGRFLDVMERALYNGILSGVSQAGDTFFYTNPLADDGEAERRPYYTVACCPANIARLVAQLPGFIYGHHDDTAYVNLFVGSGAAVPLSGGEVRLRQSTRYPWDGDVRIEVQVDSPREFELRVRIPGWARERPVPSDLYRYVDRAAAPPRIVVGGASAGFDLTEGFAVIRRTWQSGDVVQVSLPMPVRRVAAHEAVEENRGHVAIQRGPLVFAVEGVDHGGNVTDLSLRAAAELRAAFEPDLLGGMTVVHGTARRGSADVPLRAIPYFAWANRGTGPMTVWLAADN